jgi:tRNA nucleotidyltransferase (CCA-adding enzyme)
VDVVITHEFADFDALAASVAAQRIYAGSVIVFGRVLSPPVRDFLALHKDRFPSLRATDVDQDAVRRVVIVDVRRASRLKAFKRLLERIERRDPALEVHIWDHHQPSGDDLPGTQVRVGPMGSATTMLIKEIRERGLSIDALEATLFALGIHADTGSFCYPTTTWEDVSATAWLMTQGAHVGALSRYLDPPLTPAQRGALVQALSGTRERVLAGLRIGFCAIHAEERCPGLDVVTSRTRALLGLSALFLAFQHREKRTDVVARAATPLVDVGRLLEEHLGGGGHPSAASAVVRNATSAEVIERLEGALLAAPPRPDTVEHLMSRPVRTVPHDATLAAVQATLDSCGYTGVPVVREGRLAGIVSRRDIAQARRAGRLSVPASGFMTHRVHVIAPEASVEEAFELMKTEDVGRLPVVRGERIVGIVTRSDLLRVLYAD